MVLRRWERSKQNFGFIKLFDKTKFLFEQQIATLRLKCVILTVFDASYFHVSTSYIQIYTHHLWAYNQCTWWPAPSWPAADSLTGWSLHQNWGEVGFEFSSGLNFSGLPLYYIKISSVKNCPHHTLQTWWVFFFSWQKSLSLYQFNNHASNWVSSIKAINHNESILCVYAIYLSNIHYLEELIYMWLEGWVRTEVKTPEIFQLYMRQSLRLSSKCEDHFFNWRNYTNSRQ